MVTAVITPASVAIIGGRGMYKVDDDNGSSGIRYAQVCEPA